MIAFVSYCCRRCLLICAVVVLVAGITTARAATFHPLAMTGPSSNRLDIAFLAEGYTSNQVSKFLSDCTNALSSLLSRSPFKEYKSHVNAGAIAVASKHAGSDHPAYGLSRDTYFNSTYDSASDYLITIPSGASGQGKVDALLATYMPSNELSVLLVNDVVFGGSDGFGKLAIVSAAPASDAILAHESGHVLAGLGDEYATAYPGFPDVEEPNTTRETRREFIKWKAWIAPETPLPTPETFDYAETVGAFEGAHYHATGWFRPKLDCTMNSMQAPFCEVCREALVLAFYQKTRPIEGRSPQGGFISASPGQTLNFSLGLLQPMSRALQVDWAINGFMAQSGTNQDFSCAPTQLRVGTNLITASVIDDTEFVRSDPKGLLRSVTSWQVVAQAPPVIRLTGSHTSSTGQFVFYAAGVSGSFRVETSTNLLSWSVSSTNYDSSGGVWVTNSAGPQQVFYRVLQP